MATRVGRLRIVEAASVDRRAGLRHPAVVARASVRQLRREPTEATLIDVSIYGCRLASTLDPVAGERVWMRLSGGAPIVGTVVWVADGVIGCRFDAPIDHGVLRSLIRSVA